jgi:hypothetical protein
MDSNFLRASEQPTSSGTVRQVSCHTPSDAPQQKIFDIGQGNIRFLFTSQHEVGNALGDGAMECVHKSCINLNEAFARIRGSIRDNIWIPFSRGEKKRPTGNSTAAGLPPFQDHVQHMFSLGLAY